jgi:hypothetical protein
VVFEHLPRLLVLALVPVSRAGIPRIAASPRRCHAGSAPAARSARTNDVIARPPHGRS